jgi:hypothetical protein
VALVAPCVLIHRRKEDSASRAHDESRSWNILRNSYAGREVVLVRIHEPARISLLAADEYLGYAVVEDDIGIGVSQIIERARVFVAQSDVQRRGRGHLPAVFGECIPSPVTQLHLRNSGLSLFHGREAQ